MCASVDQEFRRIGDEREEPATSTANEDDKRSLVLVTAGKAGVGKSTLINNLLGLKGEKAAKAKPGAEIVTRSVDYYEEVVHGITVRIIDTPSLEAMDLSSEQKQEALETLSDLTDRKVDLMLYCISLVGGRIPKDDERIVEKLTNIFGREIWGHTILVLTYGDVVLANYEQEDREHGDVKGKDQKYRELLVDFTTEFEEILKKAGVGDVAVRSILSTQHDGPGLESALAKPEIVGIPVGRHIKNPSDWAPVLFKEVIKRCRIDAIPALLKLTGVSEDTTGGAVGGLWCGTIFGIFGATAGGIIGAATTCDVRGAAVASATTGNVSSAPLAGPTTGGLVCAAVAGAASSDFIGAAVASAATGGVIGATIAGATGIGFVGGFAFGCLYHYLYAGKKLRRFAEVRTDLKMIIEARRNLEKRIKKSK